MQASTRGLSASTRSLAGSIHADPAIPALLLAMTIWGGSYVVTKAAFGAVGPFTLLALRMVISAVVLYPFARRQGFRLYQALEKRFFLFGLTGMVLHLGLEIVGLSLTSASSGALIIAASPAVTVGFAVVFLRERVTRMQIVGVSLSILGVVVVAGARFEAGYPLAWLGNLLILAGVVAWGIYTVQGRRMPSDEPWVVGLTASTIAAVLMIAPLAGFELGSRGMPAFDTGSVLAIVYLGVGASAAAYGLWNLALRHVGGSVAGPYINLVPVLGVLLGLAAGEPMTPVQMAGGAVVGVGTWLSYKGSR